ncbi:MAG: DinB family protein [bacterium]|nr:DinB family protein [bacterium]
MIHDVLRTQAGFTDFAVRKNLEGIGHEDSLRSAGEGGNSMNWVLGHLVNTRSSMLELLGGEPVTDARHGELYGRGSGPADTTSDTVALEELLRLWDASQAALLARLDACGPSDLERRVPKLFEPENEETVAEQLAAFLFHESYHTGQLGVIRRSVGKAGAIQ